MSTDRWTAVAGTPRAAAVPRVELVPHWHQHRAETTPDDPCWIEPGRTWTWLDAWLDIQRCAGFLRAQGIGHGDRVVVLDRNSASTLIVIQACGMLGAICSPPSWRLAPTEIAAVVDRIDPAIIFIGHQLRATWSQSAELVDHTAFCVAVGGDADEFGPALEAASPVAEIDSAVRSTDPLLVMMSSGTTGEPKGTLVTHANVVAHTRIALTGQDYGPGDVLMVALPMFHIGGVAYALFGVGSGAACYIVQDLTPEHLMEGMRAGCTHLAVVPSLIATLLRMGGDAMRVFSPAKVMLYGGSPMPVPIILAAMLHWPQTQFVGMFGMTELAGMATVLDDAAHRDVRNPHRLRSVGRPLAGIDLRVVDPVSLVDVPPGEIGELWWRTPQATPGYLDDHEATAALRTADGWLRSGDIGRVDEGGYIFVEDRLKDMIITDGEKVYSREVEQVLNQHPDVAESAVIGLPDYTRGETIKALIVLEPGASLDQPALLDHLAGSLAAHKIPLSISTVESLPRTPSGKILKRELRAPYWADRDRRI